jgi:hypothetical protein
MFSDLGGEEQQLNDVLMHVDEEIRLLEEMDEIERFLVEHVFINLEDGGLNEEVAIIREVKDNQMKTCNNFQDNRNPLFEEEYSTMEQDGDILQHMEECMMMMTTKRIQESCDSETNDWCMHADFEEVKENKI